MGVIGNVGAPMIVEAEAIEGEVAEIDHLVEGVTDEKVAILEVVRSGWRNMDRPHELITRSLWKICRAV